MAGASEKKRSVTAAATIKLYSQIVIALYVAYFFLRVIWYWSSFHFSTFFIACLFTGLNYLCMSMIQQSLELGSPVTGPQDVLFINWAVMGLSIVWDRAWLLYLAIPAYLLYQYGGMIKQYFFPGNGGVPVEATKTAADEKREKKKERQAERAAKLQGR